MQLIPLLVLSLGFMPMDFFCDQQSISERICSARCWNRSEYDTVKVRETISDRLCHERQTVASNQCGVGKSGGSHRALVIGRSLSGNFGGNVDHLPGHGLGLAMSIDWLHLVNQHPSLRTGKLCLAGTPDGGPSKIGSRTSLGRLTANFYRCAIWPLFRSVLDDVCLWHFQTDSWGRDFLQTGRHPILPFTEQEKTFKEVTIIPGTA